MTNLKRKPLPRGIRLLPLFWITAAQALTTELTYVYPAGGARGDAVDIEVGGTGLPADTRQATFSGDGVSATYLGPVTTPNKKGKPTTVPNRHRFRVLIENNAAPGPRALRIGSAARLSTPVNFEISALPELTLPATNALPAAPVTLNGRLTTTNAHTATFTAQPGATLIALTSTAALPMSGFRPTLDILDAHGAVCPGTTMYGASNATAALAFDAPAAGTYTLRIRPGAGSPGHDAVYRLTFGALPLVTGLTPASAKEGARLNVQLTGHNLPQQRVRLFTGGKDSAACLAALTQDALPLPGLTFGLTADAPQPDFTVWLTPASLTLPANGSAAFRLTVERQNGFDGAITVAPDYLPLSVKSEGGTIPAGHSEHWMTISTDGQRYPRKPFALPFTASAEINGQTVRRTAIPSLAGPAGQPPRAFEELMVQVSPATYALKISEGKQPLALALDKPTEIRVQAAHLAQDFNTKYGLTVLWPAQGITIAKITDIKQAHAAVHLKVDPAILKSGHKGRLILGCHNLQSKTRVICESQSAAFQIP